MDFRINRSSGRHGVSSTSEHCLDSDRVRMSSQESSADASWDAENASDVESDAVVPRGGIQTPFAWEYLFGAERGGSDVEAGPGRTFDDLLSDMVERAYGDPSQTLPVGSTLVLPRVDPDEFRSSVLFRADVDSIKGLVHLANVADVFHPQPSTIFGVHAPLGEIPVKVHVLTSLPKSVDHLRGVGFTRNPLRSKSSGIISIPKVPKPTLCNRTMETGQPSWYFPSYDTNERQSWISLADIPHFLLGTAVGESSVELNLWCICFGAAVQELAPFVCKQAAQKVLRFVKEKATEAVERLLAGEGPIAGLDLHRTLWEGETFDDMVYHCIRKWHSTQVDLRGAAESVYGYLTRWETSSVVPAHITGSDRFVATPVVMDIICKLFDKAIDANALQILPYERDALRNSMIYLEGKGLKERICTTSVEGTTLPDKSFLVQMLDRFVPSLRRVSRGLCRIDVGYEWMIRRSPTGVATLWSIGNYKKLLAVMPPSWRRRARMYTCLGLAEAVDLQVHYLYWIPPPPNESYNGGEVPIAGISSIPTPNGLQYMDTRVPGAVVDNFVLGNGETDHSLFQDVSVLNIYCPGPRKLSSSFGKDWGLDFDPIGPVMALMAELGEGTGLRTEMSKGMQKTRAIAHGFISHVEAELQGQRTWTLRAEVGGKSIESACRLLDFFAASNAFSNITSPADRDGLRGITSKEHPICLHLDKVSFYMSRCIRTWLEKLEEMCRRIPMTKRVALTAICCEQALKSLTFLVRGQNPWSSTVSRVLIHGGILRDGVLFPSSLVNLFSSLDDCYISDYLSEVNSVFVSRHTHGQPKGKARHLARVFQLSHGIQKLIDDTLQVGERALEQRCIHLIARLLKTFYADLREYLVKRKHWSRTCSAPPVLCQHSDCTFEVDTMCTRLKDPQYNMLIANQSLVHPDSGRGRRTISGLEFLKRWFPVGKHAGSTPPPDLFGPRSKWFLCTQVVWDVVSTSFDDWRMSILQGVFAKVIADVRLLRDSEPDLPESSSASGILAPDGRGPCRPFNTLNRWQVVVGPLASPFRPPSPEPRCGDLDDVQQVTREVLNREYNMFRARSRRGFTNHELNVFSMYLLLEGAEDRLNDVTNAHSIRCSMAHVEAFLNPEKALLYCFRIRRTVQQVTDKFNAACRARGRRTSDWSLQEVVRRLRNCLRDQSLGVDGRLNKVAAYEWLVAHRSQTLEAYRASFDTGMGPILDQTNCSLWHDHLAVSWSHPIPSELCPFGSRGSENPTRRLAPEPRRSPTRPWDTTNAPEGEDSPPCTNPHQFTLDEVVEMAEVRRTERAERQRPSTSSTFVNRGVLPTIIPHPSMTALADEGERETQVDLAEDGARSASDSYYVRRSGFQE